jgi:short-subunit dehydrogenase
MKTMAITGGSSGIGKVTSQVFAACGYRVYELSRHGTGGNSITHIDCDITDRDACCRAVRAVIEDCGKIDVLINNAGMGISGAVEFTDMDEAKRQFDVNFFGAINVTQAVLPYMRAEQEGRIIFVSSLAAEFPIPFQGFYSASKAAVNSLACALRNELSPFGIGVCCMLPGDVRTNFTASRTKSNAGSGVYKSMNRAVETMEHDEQHGLSSVQIARKLLSMAEAKRPGMYCTTGLKYHAIMFLNRLLPKSFVNFVVGKIYG